MTPFRQKILDLFEDGRWLTNGEIIAATGFHASKVNQDLRWLIDNDKIQCKTDPARVWANVYRKSTMPSVGRIKLLDSYLRGAMQTDCTACGFPASDGKLCDSCDELYSAKSPNFYDLGGDDGEE